jgi:hypothetical protein
MYVPEAQSDQRWDYVTTDIDVVCHRSPVHRNVIHQAAAVPPGISVMRCLTGRQRIYNCRCGGTAGDPPGV